MALRAPGPVFMTQAGQMDVLSVLTGNYWHTRASAGTNWAALSGVDRPCEACRGQKRAVRPKNTPAEGTGVVQVMGWCRGYLANSNLPRATLRNLEASPFLAMSRIMAA